ncbi:hypothetical protein CN360_25325 [Bacillus cereus]|uniref:hypothetical protein n=1 Tax=Bacillus cereus TaxID=1396 RepID=UPI000BF3159A|nr:hypothetical protein [Bacillus cereus]PEY90221.1 hypothetical protein CN360_25325 [Bacillus cereus]
MSNSFKNDSIKEKQKWHEEEVMNSQAYKQAFNYRKALIEDFSKGLYLIPMAARRDHAFVKESALIFGCTDLYGSLIAINLITEEIMLNAPKRELRYMLEAIIKYAAVDQICKGKTLEEKLDYLYTKIPRSSISPIDDIEGLTDVMVADTKELYSLLSQFIHPSKKQISEYKSQFEGGNIGFESYKELDSFNRLLFRTCDIILYLLLKNMGPYVIKDVFYVLQDNKKWKFHKGKYVKTLPNKYK